MLLFRFSKKSKHYLSINLQRYKLKLASYAKWISWTNWLWLFRCNKYNSYKFID